MHCRSLEEVETKKRKVQERRVAQKVEVYKIDSMVSFMLIYQLQYIRFDEISTILFDIFGLLGPENQVSHVTVALETHRTVFLNYDSSLSVYLYLY